MGEFSGGPAVRTRRSHRCSPDPITGLGIETPHQATVHLGQKKKKERAKKETTSKVIVTTKKSYPIVIHMLILHHQQRKMKPFKQWNSAGH